MYLGLICRLVLSWNFGICLVSLCFALLSLSFSFSPVLRFCGYLPLHRHAGPSERDCGLLRPVSAVALPALWSWALSRQAGSSVRAVAVASGLNQGSSKLQTVYGSPEEFFISAYFRGDLGSGGKPGASPLPLWSRVCSGCLCWLQHTYCFAFQICWIF